MANWNVKILKYTLLPQLLPRIYRLFASGFHQIPFYMAIIYQATGLLPRGHPYLNPDNLGRYGIRHVIAAAADNLVISRKNADQVIIFFTIMAGVVLLMMQCILLAVAIVADQPAFAQAAVAAAQQLPTPLDILTIKSQYNPGPTQDLAFIILDRVFGVKTIFQSCISTGVPCLDLHGHTVPGVGQFPTAFHIAFHTLLQFYSLGIFLVSVFVIIYFIITITAETAESGTPFGQRFNHAWVPVRLILFAALLIPLNIGGTNAGLNAGQLIVLWSAKLGSNFATNAWGRFNVMLTTTPLGQSATLVGTPNAPDVTPIVKFMFVAKACKIAEEWEYGYTPDGVQAYLIRNQQDPPVTPGPNAIDMQTTSFEDAAKFSNYGNISVRFGAKNETLYENEKGHVRPFCGEVRVNVTDLDKAGGGSRAIQEMYFNLIKNLWKDTTVTQYAKCVRDRIMQQDHNPNCGQWPDADFAKNLTTTYKQYIEGLLPQLAQQQATGSDWSMPKEIREKGWAGAAIWYNKIAEMNGDVAAAALSVPQPSLYPYMMEIISEQRRMNNAHIGAKTIFDPETGEGGDIKYPREAGKDRTIAAILMQAYNFWQKSDSFTDQFSSTTGNGVLIDTVNAIFGTSGIFEMRRNTTIHPLAQLATLGKSMMFAALRNVAGGAALSLGGKLGDDIDGFSASLAKMAGSFFSTIGMATMAMAFVLYYVLPFMPFIYFFFAVTGWIKTIFEAMVGVPLWALGHIRIDGQGMAGPGASNGYFLILEIFLRPILIVFGLIASIQIFAALVTVLNQVFYLVVQNATGFDEQAELTGTFGGSQLDYFRGPADRFFYTAVYVIMCYMMGLGCFKLIDEIPASILRWAGIGVQQFNTGNEAGEVLSKTYEGATLITEKVEGGALAAVIQ